METAFRLLDRYTRAILFVKPELVIVFDRLEAPHPANFEYWLHAVNEFAIDGRRKAETRIGEVACGIEFLAPQGLNLTQTDQYDPNPWPQIKTREWHLTATTSSARKRCEFIALLRPHRAAQSVPDVAELERVEGGYILRAELTDGRVVALLPTASTATLSDGSLSTTGGLLIARWATRARVTSNAISLLFSMFQQ